MAAFEKFNCFVEDVAEKKHDLGADTLLVLLTNTEPNAADTVVDTTGGTCVVKATSNAAEIAAASGYAKGGSEAAHVTSVQSGGTYKLVLSNVVFTAGAAIGPFQWAVLYNSTAGTSSTRPVIGWWEYPGSAVTLASGETFTVQFDAGTGVLTLA